MRRSHVPVGTAAIMSLLVAACSSALSPVPTTTPTPTPSQPPASVSEPSTPRPTIAPTESPSHRVSPSSIDLPIHGTADEIGERVLMAPGSGGDLYLSIPESKGTVLARLDSSGSPRLGWPIRLADASPCGLLLPVDDGSVRVVCQFPDQQTGEGPPPTRGLAFDADGSSLPGWPLDLPYSITGRVVGDVLTVLGEEVFGTDFEVGQQIPGRAWMVMVAADGMVREGSSVPFGTHCCDARWAVGPDGIAYGTFHEVFDPSVAQTSQLQAIGPAGVAAGFPVEIKGIASRPAFDAAGRIHVTVAPKANGQARTVVFDNRGRIVDGGSGALGFAASDECVGVEGSCEDPAAPLVASDGATFVIGAFFNGTTVSGVSPAGQIMAGWPYRSDAGHQARGICAPGEVCEGYNLTAPAIGPGDVVYLVNGANAPAVGGSIVAIGRDGRLRPGWPVQLRKPGAAFWSVVVGSNGTAFALAIEPEAGGASSGTVLAIAPDSTVVYTATLVGR